MRHRFGSWLTLVATGFLLVAGSSRGEEMSAEKLFDAYCGAVRTLNPKEIIELCDAESIAFAEFFVSGGDPESHPIYSGLANLPAEIERKRTLLGDLLEKIPESVTDPRERLERFIRLRMEQAGDAYCRQLVGRIVKIDEFGMIEGIEHPSHEMSVSFEGSPYGRVIPMGRTAGGWVLCPLVGEIVSAAISGTLNRLSPTHRRRKRSERKDASSSDNKAPGDETR